MCMCPACKRPEAAFGACITIYKCRRAVNNQDDKQQQYSRNMASSAQPITIPSSLFDVYQEYKASTATVLTWLCSHEAITPQSGLTVNSLQRAAENIRSKDILVPAMIYRAFRDSVAKRQKVTTWFTSAELSAGGNTSGSTLKHVHFTEKYFISDRILSTISNQLDCKMRSRRSFQMEIPPHPDANLARLKMKIP